MHSLENLMANIFDHACPNGGVVVVDGLTGPVEWHRFYIETHCVAWLVTARKSADGWVIHSVTNEDC